MGGSFGRWMIGLIAVHSSEQAEFVRLPAQVRKQVGDPESTASPPTKCRERGHEFACSLIHPRPSIVPDQLWLVIKRVNVGRRAAHEQHDHMFGSSGKMGLLGRQWIRALCLSQHVRRCHCGQGK